MHSYPIQRRLNSLAAICTCAALIAVLLVPGGVLAAKKTKSAAKKATSGRTYGFFYGNVHVSTRIAFGGNAATIRDRAGNFLWKAPRGSLGHVYAKILPRELDRFLASPIHHHSVGEHQRAISMLQDVSELLPRNPVVFYLLGQNYVALGDTNEAEKAFKRAIASQANDFDSLMALGGLYFTQEKFSQAINVYDGALNALSSRVRFYERKEKSIDPHFTKGRAQQEYKDALKDREATAKQSLVFAYSRHADNLYYQGKQKAALAAIENAMTLLPKQPGLMETYRIYSVYLPPPAGFKEKKDDLEIWQTELQNQISEKRFDQAYNLVQHLRSLYPANEELVTKATEITQAIAESREGYDKIDFLLSSVERDKDLELVHKDIENELNNLAKADELPIHLSDLVSLSKRFIKTAPKAETAGGVVGDIHLLYASELFQIEDFDKAKKIASDGIAHAKESAELSELLSKIHIKLAEQFTDQGNIAGSIESLEQAVKTGKASFGVRTKLAGMKLRRLVEENYQIVVLLLLPLVLIGFLIARISLHLKKRNALRRNRLDGWKAYQKQQWDIAIDQLSRYIRQAKGVVQFPIYQALADSYSQVGDLESALTTYKKISYLFPKSNCYLDEAKIYIEQGRIPLLTTCLKRSTNLEEDVKGLIDFCFNAIEEGKNVKTYQEVIGSLYLTISDYEHAKYIFTQVITHYQNQLDVRYSYRQLIEIAKREKNTERLTKILKSYRKSYPDDGFVHVEFGNYYESTGNEEKALEHFRIACQLSYSEELEEKITAIQRKSIQSKLDEALEAAGDHPSPSSRLRIASLKYQIGDYQGCIGECNALINDGQAVTEAMRLLGLAFYYTEEFSRSAECLQQYIQNSGESITSDKMKEAKYRLARAYMKQNLLELAVREFQEIHNVDPRFRDVSEKIYLNLTTCPYCNKSITTQETVCPHCNIRVRTGGNLSADSFMIGNNQYAELDPKTAVDSDEVEKPDVDSTSLPPAPNPFESSAGGIDPFADESSIKSEETSAPKAEN